MPYLITTVMVTKSKHALADLPSAEGRCWGFRVSSSSYCRVNTQHCVSSLSHFLHLLSLPGLPLQTKVELLKMVEEEIKDKFLQEEDVAVYKSYLPQGIGLVTSSADGSHLVATRRFEIGQPLFINSAELIPMEDLRSKKFLLDVDGKYILLDKDHHFIYRDGYAEMLGKSMNELFISHNTRCVLTYFCMFRI